MKVVRPKPEQPDILAREQLNRVMWVVQEILQTSNSKLTHACLEQVDLATSSAERKKELECSV